ncbi:MAG: alpha-amylase [Spirochaetales bacterium]|nr:alpha-amylase [Spirochaetales bacterium]
MRIIKYATGFLITLFIIASCATGKSGGALEEVPGTIETKGHPMMDKVAAVSGKLNIADDEIVLYYYRNDENYDPWGFWLWAPGSGDGSVNWDISKNIKVLDGVGYLRFKKDGSDLGQSAVNPAGEIGFIRRSDKGWDNQTPDLVWDTAAKGNEVVLFEDTLEPAALGGYKPSFKAVVADSANMIKMSLSGRHALAAEPSANGFTITDGNGNIVPISDMVNMRAINNRSKNFTSNIYIKLGADLDPMGSYRISHPKYLAPANVDTSALALLAIDKMTPEAGYTLGALYNPDDSSVEFRLWSPFAASVKALIYSKSIAVTTSEKPVVEIDLDFDETTGVWSAIYGDTDLDGYFYEYKVTQNDGMVKTALDPYARSMDAYMNQGGSGRAAIVNLNKALPEGGWEGFETAQDKGYYQKREDAVIYEVSVRDFTISPDSGVKGEPGTYSAFIEKLPYLADLGVTHIQLMPVLNFYYTDETDKAYVAKGGTTNNNYNWGYDPHNYFTPEGWYASDASDPYARMVELKDLVKAAHEQGMRVLLDVVYNHMGTTNFLEDVVPGYYFRKTRSGAFTSNSGCGNDVATTRKMSRKLIVDSLAYWVEEYKVDGFRFDLMGLLDTETVEAGYAAASAIRPDVLFEGEGWSMYNGPSGTKGTEQSYMTSTDNITVFNDEIRNMMKGGGFNDKMKAFLTDGSHDAEAIFMNLTGRPQNNYRADSPGDSMLYIAAHDNLALADNIAYNLRLDPSDSRDRMEIAQRVKLGNFLILTGQGISFLHGGQERGRSKPNVMNDSSESIGRFVSNSYDSADDINQFVWNIPGEYQAIHDFTKGMIEIRKMHDIFRLGDMALVEQKIEYLPQSGDFMLAYRLEGEAADYYVLANTSTEARTFELKKDVTGAVVLADGTTASNSGIASPSGVSVSGSRVELSALTPALILVK